MIDSDSSDTRYEYRDRRVGNPGNARAETAAPPVWSSRSRTATDSPVPAR